MMGTPNNGHRIQAKLPDYEGIVGVVDKNGILSVSYTPTGGTAPKTGDRLVVMGAAHKVVSSQRSSYVPSMVVLKLVRV